MRADRWLASSCSPWLPFRTACIRISRVHHAHRIEESPSGSNYANCLAFRVREERQVRLRNEQAQMNWKFPEALDPHLAKRCAPLPLELAEARKAIVLSVCCGVFFTAFLACNAQTFGDVRVVNEPRNLTQGAPDPAISRWLMRLPADENSVERSSADAGLRGAMLDDNPIGGELQGLITPARSNESAERLLAAGGALILDPHPIGGEVYHLSRRILTRRPARDLTAGIPRRERGISVGHRLRGSTDNREIADSGAVKAGHRAVPLGSPARGIHSTRTRGSSRPLVAVRTRAAQTRAPSPAPVTTIQPGYPYYWQPWDWGYPQPPAPPAAH